MKYTTSFINKNFLLKVYGYNETGERGLRSDSKYKYIDINN